MFKNILLSSDFLMTSDSEQQSNLKWLHDLLKRPIQTATSIEIEEFFSTQNGNFIRKSFFEKSNIELNEEDTQFYFKKEEISEESKNYLRNNIKDSLLIGYEFSLQTRELLEEMNITYVDLWLHPIRYMDDILFGFNSNNKDIFNSLTNYNVSDYYFYMYADRFKISTYKGYKRHNIKLEDNSVLFIGQTLEDKAIMKDGKMLNILDFKKEMKELSKTYSKIYYSRHPYVKGDDKILEYIKETPYIEITEHPAYVLLAQDEIKKVISVSSSVVLEAKYFSKEIDILYKPVIDLSTDFSLNSYLTIMQDFVYPQFWSNILKSVCYVKECENIQFFNKKDKLRDMLGFYWSYKIIDKVEMMRNQLNAVDRFAHSLAPKPKPKAILVEPLKKRNKVKTIIKDEKKEWKRIQKLISENDVISFDIFDTLLIRPLEHPNDIFDYMEEKVEEMTNGKIKNFKELRLKARGLVKVKNCGEEVCLKERYDALAEYLNLPTSMTDEILELELMIEKTILYKREFTNSILEEAKKQNKKVIIISDIFFSREYVEEVLRFNNIVNYDKLYVSSETKLLKHTGNIFPFVLNDLGIDADRMLHIGDNIIPDIQQPEKYGINTLHIDRTADYFKVKSGLDKSFNFQDTMSRTLIKGLVANKMMDNNLNYSYPSHSNGDIELMGYSMVGSMFYGFAKWVLDEAKKEGLKNLYFLARDGQIIKEIYDIIAKDDKDAPKSHYVYVSRRALSVPSINNEDDIEELCKINFSNTPLKKMLKNRFGLDISKLDLKDSEFESENDIVNSKDHGDKLFSLLLLNKDIVFAHAKKEKEMMIEYLYSKGLKNNEETAIVDIGHNGTLQKRMIQMLNNKNIGGYYFITYSEIEKNIINQGSKAKGYLANAINGRDKRYPYNKYILMFEACFLNKEGSFVSFERDHSNQLKRVHLPVDEEQKRIDFINKLHNGIINFSKDLYNLSHSLEVNIKINGRESINPYLSMLNHPYELDSLMFNKVSFENVYSGRDRQYMIYFDKKSKKRSFEKSLWHEGVTVLNFPEQKKEIKKEVILNEQAKVITTLMTNLNKLNLISNKKFKKFEETPKKFFDDSKFKFLGKYF